MGPKSGNRRRKSSSLCYVYGGEWIQRQGSFESPASAASYDLPMTRSRYRAAGISPTIHEHTPSPLNTPGTRDIDPASKECGGGGSFVGIIYVHAKTQAAEGAADKRGKRKYMSHLKTASRGWSYKARLPLSEKGEKNVYRAQF